MSSLFLSLALSLRVAAAAEPSPGVSLTVEVHGVASAEGLLQIGLYQEAGFPDVGSELLGITLPAQAGTMSAQFTGVPPGTYAIAVIHDLNSSSTLDTNLFGVPQEDYAFSEDARGLLGPPDFTEAAVELKKDTAIVIRLN